MSMTDFPATGPGYSSDRRAAEPRKITVKVVFARTLAMHFEGDRLSFATNGLDGDLARLQEWPRREDGPVNTACNIFPGYTSSSSTPSTSTPTAQIGRASCRERV